MLICISGAGFSYTWPETLGPTPWRDGLGDKVQMQELCDFDYTDVGALTPASDAVPVVIKSLVFPPGV